MHAKYHSAWFPVTMGRFVILLSILLLTIGTLPPAASAAAAASVAVASGETPGKIFLPTISNGNASDSTPPEPLPPTAQELILADQAAGTIDANTALLYRAYARFGDPRLPAKYGGGFMVDDPVFDELAADPNLPADLKAQLEPFLVRPDDPRSVYNTPAGITPTASEASASAQTAGLPCDAYGWASELSSTLYGDHQIVPVNVHAKCTGTEEQDIQTTLQYMGELYQPMTALMGEPILDDSELGGGPQIDVYLLNPKDEYRRYSAFENPLGTADGMVFDSPPWFGNKSSGYILMDRKQINSGIYYKATLAHELFHILQLAHNGKIMEDGLTSWWFTEASATWSEIQFVPEASARAHKWFTNEFQYSDESLHVPGDESNRHPYAAYIWPFFMDQEKGPESIANVWKNLEEVGSDRDAAMEMVDHELPFIENFRRFTLRNLNVDLEPGNAIQPRYINHDPKFPDGVWPDSLVPMGDRGAKSRDDPIILSHTVPSLQADYYFITFKTDVLRVELDLSKIAGMNGVAVGALVKKHNGSWQYQDLTGQSKLKWCDLQQMYLIISNERVQLNDPIDYMINMYPLAESCICPPIGIVEGWNASFNLSYSIQADNATKGITDSRGVTLGGYLEPPYPTPIPFNFTAKPTGNGYINSRTVFHHASGDTLDTEYTGSGLPLASYGSHLSLTFDLQSCVYRVLTDIYINATVTEATNPPRPVDILIVHAGSGDIPIPENFQQNGLTGSGNWPVHSLLYYMQNPGSYDYFQDLAGVFGIRDENSMGAAKVSWSFIPVLKQ